LNRRKTESQSQRELNTELGYFDKLSVAGKREAFKDLYLDYTEANAQRIQSDTKAYKARKRHISNKHKKDKKRLSPAFRTKGHSASAAGIITMIGQFPLGEFIGGRSYMAIKAIISHEIFITWMTTLTTWCIGEWDHRKRK